jgi:hypothetical protein
MHGDGKRHVVKKRKGKDDNQSSPRERRKKVQNIVRFTPSDTANHPSKEN